MTDRRNIWPLALAGMLAAGVVAWQVYEHFVSPAADRVTIRFWNGFTGPDGRTMLRLVKQFNRENPDVQVLMQRIEWGTYYNKLLAAGIGGRAPEVFVSHTSILPRFAQADLLSPIDDLLAGPDGLDTGDFDANIWQAVVFDGRPLALPLDVHPTGMYYNRKLLREAGILDENGEPKPPRQRDAFLNALHKLTRNSDGHTKQWGFALTWYRTNVMAVMRQFGGRFFTEDDSRCTLDDPANVDALQFCVDLIHKHRVAPDSQGAESWIGFRQGKVAIAFEGPWMLGDLERQQDIDYGGAPLPMLGDRPATVANSHTLCLRGDLEGERRDMAWRLIAFLSDHSLDWAEGGQVPVRKSLRDTDRFRAMAVQSSFAEQIPYVHFPPRTPSIFEFLSEFDLAVERALRGSVTPTEALRAATERINRVIARDRRAYADREGDE